MGLPSCLDPQKSCFPQPAQLGFCLTPVCDKRSLAFCIAPHSYQPWLKEQTKQIAAGCRNHGSLGTLVAC